MVIVILTQRFDFRQLVSLVLKATKIHQKTEKTISFSKNKHQHTLKIISK